MADERTEDEKKVGTSWCWCDIQSLPQCTGWSEEKCQAALDVIRNRFRDAWVMEGWELLVCFLGEYEEEIEEAAANLPAEEKNTNVE